MKLKLFVALLTLSVLIGCTRKSDLELRTEEYEVVKEGTAEGWPDDLGVTEVAPLTDTDVDTTTSFSILGTDVPADSTALAEDPALAGRLGDAVTPAPTGRPGAPPVGRSPVSRTPSAAADAPRPSQPPAATRPAQVPREPAPTPTRRQEPAEEPAPQPEPAPETQPEPEPEPEPTEPEPTPPTTTRTETAPPPEPTEPAPDPPPSGDPSLEDSAARR